LDLDGKNFMPVSEARHLELLPQLEGVHLEQLFDAELDSQLVQRMDPNRTRRHATGPSGRGGVLGDHRDRWAQRL
jgi:hypothetical protein